jgi:tRNA(fMet)-specific endonuclease VapC
MTSSRPFGGGAARVAVPETRIVDTDVVSFLFRGDTRAEAYRPVLTDALLAVSFMTVAELDRWALERNWGPARRARMESFLKGFTIVLPDRDLCRTWALVADRAQRKGRPIQTADAWIAATALAYDAPLVTHNRRDFADVDGLRIISISGA